MDLSRNKHTSLIIKKKFQNKHSKGYKSRKARRLTYDPWCWGRDLTPPPRGGAYNNSSKNKRWRTKGKSRMIRKYYKSLVDDESCKPKETDIFDSRFIPKYLQYGEDDEYPWKIDGNLNNYHINYNSILTMDLQSM